MIDQIRYFVSEGVSSEHTHGRPLWRDDQLHLAEWQALRQSEHVFKLTLSVDANNIALENLKAHKQGTDVHAETTDLSELMNKVPIADDDELCEIVGNDVVLDEMPQDETKRGEVLPATTADSHTLAYQERRRRTSRTARPR